jgi:hypothetical protein
MTSKGRWLALAACLVVAIQRPAVAQYYEDAMEPTELGLTELRPLRTPPTAYVGNDVCRQCHEAAYQKWLGTAHARTSVQLRTDMAFAIAKAETANVADPSRSAKCLNCHGVAADVPAAWRGPGFRIAEGVTCERCHGPGGDHVIAREDSTRGVNGTLEGPSETVCRTCHKPKPSHERLGRKPFDYAGAYAKVAHPKAAEKAEDELEPAALGIWYLGPVVTPAAAYVGSAACAHCHQEAYQRWQQSAHAQAFYGLRHETAYAMDLATGVTIGGPARNGRCLGCHATGHDVAAAAREPGFRLREGVGCEKCHGPGSRHLQAMQAHAPVPAKGLTQTADDGTCQTCHRLQRSHESLRLPAFDFPAAWGKIAH